MVNWILGLCVPIGFCLFFRFRLLWFVCPEIVGEYCHLLSYVGHPQSHVLTVGLHSTLLYFLKIIRQSSVRDVNLRVSLYMFLWLLGCCTFQERHFT